MIIRIPDYATDTLIERGRRGACRISTEDIERRIAELSAKIEPLETKLKDLKAQRNRLRISLRVRRMHATDAEFVAKLRAGFQRLKLEDPEAFMRRQRTAAKKLPEMTAEQRRRYNKMRRRETRDVAVRYAMAAS